MPERLPSFSEMLAADTLTRRALTTSLLRVVERINVDLENVRDAAMTFYMTVTFGGCHAAVQVFGTTIWDSDDGLPTELAPNQPAFDAILEVELRRLAIHHAEQVALSAAAIAFQTEEPTYG